MPALLKPNLVNMQGAIDEVNRDLDAKIAARGAKATAAAAETKKTAEAIAGKAAGKQKEFKSESSGISEFASKLRESIFTGKENTDKQKIDLATRTAKASEESRDLLKKGIPAVLS